MAVLQQKVQLAEDLRQIRPVDLVHDEHVWLFRIGASLGGDLAEWPGCLGEADGPTVRALDRAEALEESRGASHGRLRPVPVAR